MKFRAKNVIMESMKKLNFAKIFGWIFLLFLVGGSIFVGANFRRIQDYFKAKNFKPSAEILQIVEKIKPTENGKQIFYATNPQLLSAENFNQNCSNSLEKTAILGCYKADEIFIFNIDNSELDGIKEVTSAHELLHAVWARMPDSERKNLGEKLRAEYEKLKTPDFEKLMESYAITQPGEHENELHSIIGTEYGNLSSELEQHYARVFENRQEIVEMNKKYRLKFKELEQNAENLSQEIKKLEAEISAEKDDYSVKTDLLNADIETFNANAKNGFYSSEAIFQRDRQNLLARVNFLTEYRAQINSKIENYESKIAELKQISTKIQRLYDSINSKIEKVEGATSL